MKHILVTGAAGFIGAHTVQLLLEQGHEVVGIDNLNDYYDVRLKQHRLETLHGVEGFKFLEMDIEDRGALESLFAGYNLAARAGVRYSMINPYVYYQTNVLGTLNLLECLRQFKVPRFILASTSSLYSGADAPFSESKSTDRPISTYAASKKAAEVLAHSYTHNFGIHTTVLRFFTVYGPAGRPDMGVFRFIQNIANGKPIDLYGDGTQARDFTYVTDVSKAIALALDHSTPYDILNVGGGRQIIQINELIALIEKELGRKADIKHHPANAADMFLTHADPTRMEDSLGWQPETDIETGIRRTVEWYLTNREFVDGLEPFRN